MLPIERPQKIVCVGLNYRDHAEEQGADLPERPLLFAKWPNTLIGPGEPIVIPDITERVDYEAELGVVIGSSAHGVSVENALEAVAGYLCANDVTARDLQHGDGQWTRGKSLDTFCPVGPALVPAADVPDPQALGIRAILNGEVMQDSTTANMVFGVAEIVAFVSQAITLEPGDLILTGTPAGVGVFRDPPVLLQPGDEITDRDRRRRCADQPGERRLRCRSCSLRSGPRRRGEEARVRNCLERFAPPSREEPGCRFYQPCLAPQDPHVFRIVEIYDDQAALEAHASSDHFGEIAAGEAFSLLESRERAYYEMI